MLVNVNENELNALKEMCIFVQGFVRYHIDEKPVEDGIQTDAQRMSFLLPLVNRIIEAKEYVVLDKDKLSKLDKNILYQETKIAKESVNPNYKYCVVDSEINECYLTQDLFSAMKKAKSLSIIKDNFCYVLEIRKVNDGTYRTFKIFAYKNDYHKDYGYGEMFLHFNYIAERVLEPIIL